MRSPSEAELKATAVLKFPIEEASAKVRIGPALDDEADYLLPVWAEVLPLHMEAKTPVPDSRLMEGVAVPEYIVHYRRKGTDP